MWILEEGAYNQIVVVIKTHELIVQNNQKGFQFNVTHTSFRRCKYSEFAFFLQYKVLSSFQLFPTAVFQKVIWWYLELFWIFCTYLESKYLTRFQSMTQIKKSSMPSKNHPDHHVLVNSQYLQPVASDDVYSELLMTAGDEGHAPLGQC